MKLKDNVLHEQKVYEKIDEIINFLLLIQISGSYDL